MAGIGDAYVGMGLAQGINDLQSNLRDRQAEIQAREQNRRIAERQIAEQRMQDEDRMRQHAQQDVAQERAGIQFGQAQEGYQHDLQRRPVLEGREAESYGLGLQMKQADIADIPLKRQQLQGQIAGQGIQRQAAQQQLGIGAMQMQNAQRESKRQQAADQFNQYAAQARRTGDPSYYAKWYDENIPDEHKVEIVPSAKGGFDMNFYDVSGGAPVLSMSHHANDMDGIEQLGAQALDPAMFAKTAELGERNRRYTTQQDANGNLWRVNMRDPNEAPTPMTDPASGQQLRGQPRGMMPFAPFAPGATPGMGGAPTGGMPAAAAPAALVPPPSAVAHLRANMTAGMVQAFDAKFGPGAAARALGAQ